MYTLKAWKWFASNTLHINAKNLYLWKVHFDGPRFKSKKTFWRWCHISTSPHESQTLSEAASNEDAQFEALYTASGHTSQPTLLTHPLCNMCLRCMTHSAVALITTADGQSSAKQTRPLVFLHKHQSHILSFDVNSCCTQSGRKTKTVKEIKVVKKKVSGTGMNNNIPLSHIKLPQLSRCDRCCADFCSERAFWFNAGTQLPDIFVPRCFPYVRAHNAFSSRDKGA